MNGSRAVAFAARDFLAMTRDEVAARAIPGVAVGDTQRVEVTLSNRKVRVERKVFWEDTDRAEEISGSFATHACAKSRSKSAD